MCVRERLLTGILKVQIHESENIYDRQTQLDKAAVEMRRRRGGFNFQRRRLPTFFCKDDDIMSTSSLCSVATAVKDAFCVWTAGFDTNTGNIIAQKHVF